MNSGRGMYLFLVLSAALVIVVTVISVASELIAAPVGSVFLASMALIVSAYGVERSVQDRRDSVRKALTEEIQENIRVLKAVLDQAPVFVTGLSNSAWQQARPEVRRTQKNVAEALRSVYLGVTQFNSLADSVQRFGAGGTAQQGTDYFALAEKILKDFTAVAELVSW